MGRFYRVGLSKVSNNSLNTDKEKEIKGFSANHSGSVSQSSF